MVQVLIHLVQVVLDLVEKVAMVEVAMVPIDLIQVQQEVLTPVVVVVAELIRQDMMVVLEL